MLCSRLQTVGHKKTLHLLSWSLSLSLGSLTAREASCHAQPGSPVARPTWQKSVASNQQLREGVTLEVNPLAPVKP